MAFVGIVFTVISRDHYLTQAQLAASHVPMYQVDPVAPPNALINTTLGSAHFGHMLLCKSSLSCRKAIALS